MKVLKENGEFVSINNHNIHIYRAGNIDSPKLVFMSGSGTVAPVYDFKILYEKLVKDFRIVVIEKFGYGYSDIFESSCDIDSMVDIEKQALEVIEEKGPYILVSHSASGLEAIRWKQKYPDDVLAIVGIDMATPLTYKNWSNDQIEKRISLMKKGTKFGLYKILCPLSNRSLNNDEIIQQKMLRKRNAFNNCYINEAKEILTNSEIVEKTGIIDCPILLFLSNGKQTSKNWVECQHEFASMVDAKLISYDCGHYIHYYKSNEMSDEINKFVKSLKY